MIHPSWCVLAGTISLVLSLELRYRAKRRRHRIYVERQVPGICVSLHRHMQWTLARWRDTDLIMGIESTTNPSVLELEELTEALRERQRGPQSAWQPKVVAKMERYLREQAGP